MIYLLLLIQSTLHYSKRSFAALVIGMSGSGKKRSSKWDLRDELESAPGRKQMRSGWFSADTAGSRNDTLRPVKEFSSEESFSGGSGSNKDDIMHKEHRVLDATTEWETEGSRRQKMSPRIEEWKQKRHSQSPENGWSRSVRFVSLLSVCAGSIL